MENKKFEKLTSTMQNKLDKNNKNLIDDDIATLITENANQNKEIEKRDNEIKELRERNEKLIMSNGNLLQQVKMGYNEDEDYKIKEKREKSNEEEYDMSKAFDEKGNFI